MTDRADGAAAPLLLRGVEQVLGGPAPLRVRAWDGSEAGAADGPVLVVRHRRALRHLVWSPDELGLARAFVSGDLDVEGDLFEAVAGFLAARAAAGAEPWVPSSRAGLLRDAARLGTLGPRPRLPREELRRRRGRRHSRGRDARAVRSHYDVGNDFYALVLGPSLVYSCAYWADGLDPAVEADLDRAQHDKLELVCTKLGLRPGMRLLDVGCGWGSMVLHAAREHGVRAVGVTVSPEQAGLARARVAEAGLEHLVEVRLQDYRDVDDGPYDAVSSIGMAEHVGREQLGRYAEQLHGLLAPGGRLLHHVIGSRRRPGPGPTGPVLRRALRVPGRRAAPPRRDGHRPAGRRVRGPGRAGPARALRPHPAGLGGPARGALGRGRRPGRSRPRAGVAAVHGGLRRRLRGRAGRRRPGPRRRSDGGTSGVPLRRPV